jgi:hypothetical protein
MYVSHEVTHWGGNSGYFQPIRFGVLSRKDREQTAEFSIERENRAGGRDHEFTAQTSLYAGTIERWNSGANPVFRGTGLCGQPMGRPRQRAFPSQSE